MKNHIRFSSLAIAAAAFAILAFPVAPQTPVRIGGWALSGNGQLLRNFEYAGGCPVDLKFDWGVISAEPTTVTYTFSRSDGAQQSSQHSLNIPNGNQSVPILQDWHLGANSPQFASFTGWLQLDILSPKAVSSRINFTIHCGAGQQEAPYRIGGQSLRANGQLAQGFQYTGSCPVDLQFGWGVVSSSPTTISYTFNRNDGGHTTNALSANLPGGGRSQPIYDRWQLGANTAQFADYKGWVELNVESPVLLNSKIGFTIHCQ